MTKDKRVFLDRDENLVYVDVTTSCFYELIMYICIYLYMYISRFTMLSFSAYGYLLLLDLGLRTIL